MNHLTKAILGLLLALLMVVCYVIDIVGQSWIALVICIIAFVFDNIDEFATWIRERGKKDNK